MIRAAVICFILAALLLAVMQLVHGQSECDLPLEERPDTCFSTPAVPSPAATETPSMAIRTPYPEPDPYPLNSLQLRSSRQRQETNDLLKTVFAIFVSARPGRPTRNIAR